jgi:1-acyl-sn-glycerol-3-phosphate acyltransferase
VPVVPVAIYGSDRVRQWRQARFPRVTVSFGEPLRFEPVTAPNREHAMAAAEAIFAQVEQLYAASERR